MRLRLTYPYAHTAAVMRGLERSGAAQVEHGYVSGGDAGRVDFAVPLDAEPALAEELREASGGVLVPERTGELVLYRNAPA